MHWSQRRYKDSLWPSRQRISSIDKVVYPEEQAVMLQEA